MVSQYSSLEQIKKELQIDENAPDKIRSRLRTMQSSIHPDRNEGSFSNEEDEILFHKLSQAIEFIDQKEETGALVPISAVTELTKAVTELVKTQAPIHDNSLSEQIKGNIESYRNRFKIPKIALSSTTVALSAVWLFPNTIKNHPVLGVWFDISSPIFKMAWVNILILTDNWGRPLDYWFTNNFMYDIQIICHAKPA